MGDPSTEPEVTTTTTTNPQAKYSKLLGVADYDHEAAEQLAEAINEVLELEAKAEQFKLIVAENKKLHAYVWKTADGKAYALHNIEDRHLENIMLHLLRTNRPIPKGIRGEAIRRNLVILDRGDI